MRKTIGVLCVILLCSQAAFCAVLRSPLPSDVPGITIPNTHIAAQGGLGKVLRGGAPLRHEIRQLKDYGITDIIIFKNQTRDEVDKEILWLSTAGYSAAQIHHIPFLWKNMGTFRQSCEQTVSALRILREAYITPRKAVFFHCTVGEDRTGYLAGLFRMLAEKWTMQKAFKQELCKNGYEAGDTRKPADIVTEVRAGLTPLYLKMAALISSGVLTIDDLNYSVCESEPAADTKAAGQLRCP